MRVRKSQDGGAHGDGGRDSLLSSWDFEPTLGKKKRNKKDDVVSDGPLFCPLLSVPDTLAP